MQTFTRVALAVLFEAVLCSFAVASEIAPFIAETGRRLAVICVSVNLFDLFDSAGDGYDNTKLQITSVETGAVYNTGGAFTGGPSFTKVRCLPAGCYTARPEGGD